MHDAYLPHADVIAPTTCRWSTYKDELAAQDRDWNAAVAQNNAERARAVDRVRAAYLHMALCIQMPRGRPRPVHLDPAVQALVGLTPPAMEAHLTSAGYPAAEAARLVEEAARAALAAMESQGSGGDALPQVGSFWS